jgi:hypothetical protein
LEPESPLGQEEWFVFLSRQYSLAAFIHKAADCAKKGWLRGIRSYIAGVMGVVLLLEGSQASPACPADKSSVELNMLELLEIVA